MTDAIAIARDQILSPAGLDTGHLERLLGQLKTSAIDAADIYFQYSRLQSWVLEDGIIKEGNFNIERGAGLRALSGEKTGFAYADEVQFETLLQAAKAARASTTTVTTEASTSADSQMTSTRAEPTSSSRRFSSVDVST